MDYTTALTCGLICAIIPNISKLRWLWLFLMASFHSASISNETENCWVIKWLIIKLTIRANEPLPEMALIFEDWKDRSMPNWQQQWISMGTTVNTTPVKLINLYSHSVLREHTHTHTHTHARFSYGTVSSGDNYISVVSEGRVPG